MCDVHAEQRLDLVDCCLVARSEYAIDVTDDGLNVCRTILGHVLAYDVKVAPEVPMSLSDSTRTWLLKGVHDALHDTGRGIGGIEYVRLAALQI